MYTWPLHITTEVTSASTLLPIFYRWKSGLREAKQLGQGPLNQEAGFLIPRLTLSSLAFKRGNNFSLRGGMRTLRTLEDRGTCWRCLGEAIVRKLSGILWELQEVPEWGKSGVESLYLHQYNEFSLPALWLGYLSASLSLILAWEPLGQALGHIHVYFLLPSPRLRMVWPNIETNEPRDEWVIQSILGRI